LRRSFLACLLWPVSLIFSALAQIRRVLITPQRLPVPVVVVGGITVGGAGKTPVTLWLVEALRAQGFVPAIISRGYGGAVSGVLAVSPDSDAELVGDEPVLLRQRAQCPVFVGRDRVAAGRVLLSAHPEVNLILCDDGLQHYRLARDFEIVVLDRRGLGNGWQLPAGPLREAACRLRQIDALVLNEARAPDVVAPATFAMQLQGSSFYRLAQPAQTTTAEALRGQALHAVAGIGEPQRFFDHLSALGLSFEAHPFPDHHAYSADELAFDGGVVLTTEKDAVKLRATLPPDAPVWVLPVTAQITGRLDQLIVEKLNGRAPA
jgi:tetraacyldisaccharide 4'-kinase